MPALDGALPVVEVNRVPARIGKDLNLDMARFCEVLLDEDRRVAESGSCDPHPPLDRLFKPLLALDDVHADTAAARARLHDHRVTDIGGNLLCFIECGDALGRAGEDRDARLTHHPFRSDL